MSKDDQEFPQFTADRALRHPAETVFESACLDEFSVYSKDKAFIWRAICSLRRELDSCRGSLEALIAQQEKAAKDRREKIMWAWASIVIPVIALVVSIIALRK